MDTALLAFSATLGLMLLAALGITIVTTFSQRSSDNTFSGYLLVDDEGIETGSPDRSVGWRMLQLQKLVTCVTLDILGDVSYLIPPPADLFSDMLYAPIYGYMVYRLFASWKLAFVGFLKEILLLTDVIPMMTILWILETCCHKWRIAQRVGITHPKTHPFEGGAVVPGAFHPGAR